MFKRFVIEFGTGIDFHGQDNTGAAQKAVKDAISRSCLCGITEIAGLTDINDMYVDVTIAAPNPEKVEENKILEAVPFGTKAIQVVRGGMQVPGLFLQALGDSDDSIVVVNACVEVKIKGC